MLFSIDDPARQQCVALIDASTDVAWTYGELSNEIARRADVLEDTTKRLVFLFCQNDLDSVAWYLAAVEAGHAVALLNSQLDSQLSADLISAYRPDWIVASQADPQEYDSRRGCWQRRQPDCTQVHPDLALLLSTSGSTGSPKLVRLRRQNLEANADSIFQALSIENRDRAVAHLPLHYSYGLSVVNSHLLAGSTLLLLQQGLMSPAFWESVRRYDVNSFSGVPYTYQMLRRLGLDKLDVPAINIMTQAGGNLDSGNISHFHECMTKRQGKFFAMYGQTEATARIAILQHEDIPRKPGSVGRAIPGGTIRIQDDSGNYVESPDVAGQLVYRGPNVMMGYATRKEDLTRGDELSGCLLTGDLGRLDAEGYAFIMGRSKRDAKLFGLRINLDELEAFVRRNGPAAAVAGSGRVVIFCEFGTDSTHQEIRGALAAHLKIHHSGFEFRRIDRLPTRDSGKIDYDSLVSQL